MTISASVENHSVINKVLKRELIIQEKYSAGSFKTNHVLFLVLGAVADIARRVMETVQKEAIKNDFKMSMKVEKRFCLLYTSDSADE